MTREVTSHTLLLAIVREKLLVPLLVLLFPCKSSCICKNIHEDQALTWSRRGKMCVFTFFLQSFNNTVSLFRGEIAGDVVSGHIYRSHFSVGHSTRETGQL